MASGTASGSRRSSPSSDGNASSEGSASDGESASEADESEACESDPEVDLAPATTDANPLQVIPESGELPSVPEPPNPKQVILESEEVPAADPPKTRADWCPSAISAEKLAKLNIPAAECNMKTGSLASSSSIHTPPPKGLPQSPRSVAKHRKEHYLVKNGVHGYHCTICGMMDQDIKKIKESPCRAPDHEPGSDGQASVDEATAQQMMLDELRELEQEGLLLEGLLKEEQEQLEELMLLGELENMERELRDQEDADLRAARALSLEQSHYPKVAASKSATATLQDQEEADLRAAKALSLEESCYPKVATSMSKPALRPHKRPKRHSFHGKEAKEASRRSLLAEAVQGLVGVGVGGEKPQVEEEDLGKEQAGAGEGRCQEEATRRRMKVMIWRRGLLPLAVQGVADGGEKPGAKEEEEDEAKSSTLKKKADSKPKPKPKSKSKATPAPKSHAKNKVAKTVAKAKAKPSKGAGTRTSTGSVHDEAKKAKSRKSVAYHKAFKLAQTNGLPLDECKAAAKEAYATTN
ncbi:unnamed protein product [Symbiodinium sp. CCMP2456]|nr:unnamed protein product [Symbiodinium sp. CCMP2456]